MNFEVFTQACSAERFLATNLCSLELPPLTRVAVEEATPRAQASTLQDGTPVLLCDGHLLDSPMPPSELQALLQSVSETTLFVVFGLGMGHLVRSLRRHTRVPIILFEPDVGLLRAAFESGPLDLGDIPIAVNQTDLAAIWGRFVGQRRDVIVVNTPGYKGMFPSEAETLCESARRLALRVTITKNTYRKRARVWADDIIENISLMADNPSALALENQFPGVPAFIIGAGPSLDKNIHLVAEAAKKGLVFASNSSALALAKHGIVPQFLVCIESIDISSRLNTIPFLDQTIRTFSLSASPKTLRTGKGPLLPFYEALPQYAVPLEELLGVSGVGVCGSVSTAALSLALRLGCNPVVLVGQDMAFTAGRTYAGGTGYESSKAEFDEKSGNIKLSWNENIQKLHGDLHGKRHDTEPLVEIPAWGGGNVYSGASFMAIHGWLEATAEVNTKFNPSLSFINSTEGGARVHGFTELSLREVLADLPERNLTVPQIMGLAHARGVRRKPEELLDWVASQQRLTRRTRYQAHRARRLGSYALSTIRADNPGNIARAFGALERAESELRAAIQKVPLVDAFSHAAVDGLMDNQGETGDDARRDAEAAVTLGANVAQAIERASLDFEKSLSQLSLNLTKETETKRNLPCL